MATLRGPYDRIKKPDDTPPPLSVEEVEDEQENSDECEEEIENGR